MSWKELLGLLLSGQKEPDDPEFLAWKKEWEDLEAGRSTWTEINAEQASGFVGRGSSHANFIRDQEPLLILSWTEWAGSLAWVCAGGVENPEAEWLSDRKPWRLELREIRGVIWNKKPWPKRYKYARKIVELLDERLRASRKATAEAAPRLSRAELEAQEARWRAAQDERQSQGAVLSQQAVGIREEEE